MKHTGLKRIRAIAIGFILLSMMFMSLMGMTDTAQAQEPVYSEAALDGYIERANTSYPPTAPGTAYTAIPLVVGQAFSAGSGTYSSDRSFISFNTSYIPDDAIIQSVQLFLRIALDYSSRDFSVGVYQSDYDTLDTGDWDTFTTYQGDLLYTSGISLGQWHSMHLMGSSIDKEGFSEYVLKSSRDNTSAPTGSEWVSFHEGESTSAPYILVSYAVYGTTFSMYLTTSGTYNNGTIYADIEQWNLTYERWCFEFATNPTEACNVSISIMNDTWEFLGVVPTTDYTLTVDTLNLTDTWVGITYRVWFAVAKTNPFSTIHLSLYNAFTGEGFFWEQMKVRICDGPTWDNTTASDLARPDFAVEPEENYTLRVLDYFDNALIDYSFSANAQDVFVTIGIPYYSWQIFNMNDAPILVKIYWNNTGSPWEFFVGPKWIIERFLKGGNYTFAVTFYSNDTNGAVGDTVYYQREIPLEELNASFIYVQGTTLSEIITDIEGMVASQEIITALISPSIVLIYEDLPLAPVKIRSLALSVPIVIDPYAILEATTYQNKTGTQFVNSALWLPYPDILGATYYNISDVLSFSGTYATTIYINDTSGTNLYYNTVLPATVNLQCQNVTIWANENYSVSRASTWREVSEFAINYYRTEHKWQTTLSLNNSMSFDYHTPYWYISFPADSVIDLNTVTVFDLDNDIMLSQRTNFDVTAGGIHITLTQLNASNARNFRFTYWDENSTTGIGAPNLVAEAFTQSTLNGVPMKYTAVQWMNPWSVEYRGEIYITLNFSEGDGLLLNSITLIDETTGTVIPNSDWIYTGRVILILTDGVGTVPVGGARNYGIYFTLDITLGDEERVDFFFGPIVINGKHWYIGSFAISWFLIVIIMGWAVTGWAWWKNKKNASTLVLLAVSATVVGFYLSGVM